MNTNHRTFEATIITPDNIFAGVLHTFDDHFAFEVDLQIQHEAPIDEIKWEGNYTVYGTKFISVTHGGFTAIFYEESWAYIAPLLGVTA